MNMKIVTIVGTYLLIPVCAVAEGTDLGHRLDTEVIEGDEFCTGATLLRNDDDHFENGYCWRFGGVVPPDYGSWAECYESDFVCGVQLLFTQIGDYQSETMDVYVWESVADGNPPPGPDPGNVICVLTGVSPGPIAYWPEISTHNVQVCCEAGGVHFVGFWGNWPGTGCPWFIAGDENGPGTGCPRTKIAPGIGYPTGWQHPEVMPVADNVKDLGIREHAGLGDCQPTPNETTTWGRIKSTY
jgi:hypothetical protein